MSESLPEFTLPRRSARVSTVAEVLDCDESQVRGLVISRQQLARHADYETTLAYIQVADEVKRAAANRAAIQLALENIPTKSPRQQKNGESRSRVSH